MVEARGSGAICFGTWPYIHAEITEIRLNESSGCLRVNFTTGALFFTRADGSEERVDIPEPARRGWRVEEDFVASVCSGTPVRLTRFEGGVKYMRFTEAAFCSYKKGSTWVDV